MPSLDPEARQQLKAAAQVAVVGFELVASIALGYFGGRFLDTRFSTTPYLQYTGLALGIVSGFFSLYRIGKRATLR